MFDIGRIERACLKECSPYVPGKPIEEVQREYGLKKVIKLASNENPFGGAPRVIEAMNRELKKNTHRYPVSNCYDLVNALAKKLSISTDQIVVNNGLDGVITTIGMAFIESGDRVVSSELTFPAYRNITNKMGGHYVEIPLKDGFLHDVQALIDAARQDTKILFICNPNNPTGTIMKKSGFEKILREVPENTLIVSDDAYFEFSLHPDYPNSLDYHRTHKNLISLRTFSKLIGIAGVRVGYAVACSEIINSINKVREPFPVNRAAQAGALAALQEDVFCKKVIDHTVKERQYLYDELSTMGFEPVRSQTNFVFVKIDTPLEDLYTTLLKSGVIIRPQPFRGESYFRITVGTEKENKKIIELLKRIGGEKNDKN